LRILANKLYTTKPVQKEDPGVAINERKKEAANANYCGSIDPSLWISEKIKQY